MATYTRVLLALSHMRTTRVSLKTREVSSEKMVSLSGSLAGRVMGPVWRQARENWDGSWARPRLPDTPPVRAWLTWQVTPGTLASLKASTQTLWLAPISFQVVVVQPISSAAAGPAASRTRLVSRGREGRIFIGGLPFTAAA